MRELNIIISKKINAKGSKKILNIKFIYSNKL